MQRTLQNKIEAKKKKKNSACLTKVTSVIWTGLCIKKGIIEIPESV